MVFVSMGTLKPEALIPLSSKTRSFLPPSRRKTWKLQEFQRQRRTSLEGDCFQKPKAPLKCTISSKSFYSERKLISLQKVHSVSYSLHMFSIISPNLNVLAFCLELHNSIWVLCCSIILMLWFSLAFSLGSAFWALLLSGSKGNLPFE